MAKKSKCKMSFSGYEEIIQDIERIGGDVPKTITKAVELSGKIVTDRYKEVIKKHHFTGVTEESLVQDPKAVNDGKKITMKTGFNLNEGGLASIYLDRGTPKQKPVNYIRKIKKDKAVTGAIENVLEEKWGELIK